MQIDCDQPATCFDGYCQDVTDGNCRPGMCGTNQACVCDGTTGTTCEDVNDLDVCFDEFEDLFDCVRESGCRFSSPYASLLWNNELCVFNSCLSELMTWTCCSYCGDGTQNTVSIPPYGLTCADDDSDDKFVYPVLCAPTCTGTPSSCPALPTTTGAPTQTGSNTGTQTGSNTETVTQTGSTQTGSNTGTQTVTQTGSKTGSQSSTTMSFTTGATPASGSSIAINALLIVAALAMLL